MLSIPKIVSVLSCGVLLGLGLTANTATSADKMKADQSSEWLGRQPGLESEEGQLKGAIVEHSETMQGEVFQVEGTNYFVKGQDSKEVLRLHTDQTTQKTGNIRQGDRPSLLKEKQLRISSAPVKLFTPFWQTERSLRPTIDTSSNPAPLNF